MLDERPLKVFYWAASMVDGTFVYRTKMPMDELNRLGHDARASTQFGAWARDEADIVVGQRICQERPAVLWTELAAHRKRTGGGPALVYEVDDDLFSISPDNPLAEMYKDRRVQRTMTACIRAADAVTVSTEPLARLLRQHNPNVHVVPNAIRAEVLNVPYPPRRGRADGVTRFGWQGSQTHAVDWLEVRDPLAEVMREDPSIRMRFLGTAYPEGLPLDRGRVDMRDWTTDIGEHYRRISRFDVALAPLRDTVFNRSKCLDAATRIGTKRGMIPIGEIVPGDRVWREGWRKVEAVERTPTRTGLKLTLSNGQELKLTAEHRMMVNGEWTRADGISIDDTLTAGQNFTGASEQTWPWPANVRGGRKVAFEEWSYLSAPDSPRITITPRWGRILGAYAGDGSCAATSIRISCDGQDQDWIDVLIDDFRALGLTPSTERNIMFDGTVLRRRSVCVASASLQRTMESLGAIRQRASRTPERLPCVPEIIWRSPLPVIAEFLAGYFEADGHCTSTGVAAVSKTEQLIRDVQQLLLLFGITGKIHSRVHSAQNGFTGDYWHITLGRAAADIFVKEIGFRSIRKRARLEAITSKPHSNAYRPMSWAPTVERIEPCTMEPVDIRVEGEAFIASGLLSHNSALRFQEAAGLGVPVIASDVVAYRPWIEHGVTGFLVRTPQEWREAIRALTDPALRVQVGDAARKAAAAWTVENTIGNWINAYRSIM